MLNLTEDHWTPCAEYKTRESLNTQAHISSFHKWILSVFQMASETPLDVVRNHPLEHSELIHIDSLLVAPSGGQMWNMAIRSSQD